MLNQHQSKNDLQRLQTISSPRIPSMSNQSQYRHTFGELRRKELTFYNINAIFPSNRSIKSNGKYFVLPWATIGNYAVFDVDAPGKQSDRIPLVSHNAELTCLDISPYNESLVASGGRDNLIKLWDIKKLPTKGVMNTSDKVLSGHKKKIVSLNFNPYVSNLLLSASQDSTLKLWDTDTAQEVSTIGLQDNPDIITVEWSASGSILMSTRDSSARIIDPRSPTENPLTSSLHQSVKGCEVAWLGDDGDHFVSVGWNKESMREVATWDIRSMSKPEGKLSIDASASSLIPFYEPGTRLLYLVEKGTGVFYYEVTKREPHILNVGKFNTPNSHSTACMLPIRQYDVMKCEVARFLLAAKDTVDIAYFTVPRKSDNLFQEDLYPPVYDGTPDQDISSYLKGDKKQIKKVTLKPQSSKSVYEVSASEGGRSRMVDEIKKSGKTVEEAVEKAKEEVQTIENNIKEGDLKEQKKGWLGMYWSPCYVTIKSKGVYVFPAKFAAISSAYISFSDVSSIESDSGSVFVIKKDTSSSTDVPSEIQFKAEDDDERDKWIKSLNFSKEYSEKNPDADSEAQTETKQVSQVDKDIAAALEAEKLSESKGKSLLVFPEGFLKLLEYGYFYNSYTKYYFKVDQDLIINRYANESTTNSLEQIHLDRVVAVYITSQEEKEPTFQISTENKSWKLMCESKEELYKWVKELEILRKSLKCDDISLITSEVESNLAIQDTSNEEKNEGSGDEDDDDDDDEQSHKEHKATKQNWMKVKLVALLSWDRWSWVVAASDAIICYKNQSAYRIDKKFLYSDIESFTANKDLSPSPNFEIKMKDGSTYRFSADSEDVIEEYEEWYNQQNAHSKRTEDVVDDFGIDKADLSLSPKQLEDRLKGVIDLLDVKNGKFPILIRAIGRRKLRCHMVPCTVDSLDGGGAFVLDYGATIFQWNGAKSSKFQRSKALDIATRLRMKERGGNAKIIQLEQDKDDDNLKFWAGLGSKERKKIVKLSTEDEDKIQHVITLYRVYRGAVHLVHDGKTPSHKLMTSNSVYIVKSNHGDFWTWVGKESMTEDRKLSLLLAEKLQASHTTSKWMTWARVFDEGETILFKENFSDYPGQLLISLTQQPVVGNVSQRKEQKDLDIGKMLYGGNPPEGQMFDDGKGKLTIWKVENFDKVPFQIENYGHFWSDDSYLILYEYQVEFKTLPLLYFWQGRTCPVNEKGTLAYLTKEMNDVLKGQGKNLRVVQYQESPHFLTVFNQINIVYHQGSYKQGWNTSNSVDVYQILIRNQTPCAIQVDAKVQSLDSTSIFLVITNDKLYRWIGKHSDERLYAVSESVKTTLQKSYSGRKEEEVKESSEPSHFWTSLKLVVDGKITEESYPSTNWEAFGNNNVKLFTISNSTGVVDVTQVYHVCQDTLDDYSVSIVDGGNEGGVWVWFGSKSKIIEQKWALRTVIVCVKLIDAHSIIIIVIVVHCHRFIIQYSIQMFFRIM
eukprot:TRINITY_DN3488_c0_g1_i2.p1 TRINITY_DN3488_c0_g1~~TRINITY_DN3488_c0_g1_i2.p1  ORF type:complete len:1469 (-),score=359.82 TRINITY_DN3488_c0_g1_i2:333-4739(-)